MCHAKQSKALISVCVVGSIFWQAEVEVDQTENLSMELTYTGFLSIKAE